MNSASKSLFNDLSRQLLSKWGGLESNRMAEMVMAYVYGLSRIDIFLNKELPPRTTELAPILERLLLGEPIQYVLNQAYFFGHPFWVNNQVLIHRQETEELVALILKENTQAESRVLDLGTGSGAIAISLKLDRPDWHVEGIDLSAKALEVARANSKNLVAMVEFSIGDIFDLVVNELQYHIIVSNPPYIPHAEKIYMEDAVLNHEPKLALFVPDNDPLRFYRAIGNFAQKGLKPNGKLYLEINERFGKEIELLLENLGFEAVTILEDLNKKARMVSAIRASGS